MKKLILAAIISLSISTAFASVKMPIDGSKKASEELTNLLNSSNSGGELHEEVLVKVVIALNDENKIAYLKTDSDNDEVNSYVKEVLSNKKILSNELKVGKNYSFVVRFKN